MFLVFSWNLLISKEASVNKSNRLGNNYAANHAISELKAKESNASVPTNKFAKIDVDTVSENSHEESAPPEENHLSNKSRNLSSYHDLKDADDDGVAMSASKLKAINSSISGLEDESERGESDNKEKEKKEEKEDIEWPDEEGEKGEDEEVVEYLEDESEETGGDYFESTLPGENNMESNDAKELQAPMDNVDNHESEMVENEVPSILPAQTKNSTVSFNFYISFQFSLMCFFNRDYIYFSPLLIFFNCKL